MHRLVDAAAAEVEAQVFRSLPGKLLLLREGKGALERKWFADWALFRLRTSDEIRQFAGERIERLQNDFIRQAWFIFGDEWRIKIIIARPATGLFTFELDHAVQPDAKPAEVILFAG